MNEQDDEVAPPGNGNYTSQATIFRPNWQFAIDRLKKVPYKDLIMAGMTATRRVGPGSRRRARFALAEAVGK